MKNLKLIGGIYFIPTMVLPLTSMSLFGIIDNGVPFIVRCFAVVVAVVLFFIFRIVHKNSTHM